MSGQCLRRFENREVRAFGLGKYIYCFMGGVLSIVIV